MLGRLLRSADFERALGQSACARSAHFAIHYLPGRPGKGARSHKLSTDDEQGSSQLVDDSAFQAPDEARTRSAHAWLGMVVPKRHARRSVTRALLKRQIRAALQACDVPGQAPLRAGLWIVRLRAPFDRSRFVSASSDALRHAARAELEAALADAERSLAVRGLACE